MADLVTENLPLDDAQKTRLFALQQARNIMDNSRALAGSYNLDDVIRVAEWIINNPVQPGVISIPQEILDEVATTSYPRPRTS